MVEKVLKAMGSHLPFPRAPPPRRTFLGLPAQRGCCCSKVKEIIKNCGGSEAFILAEMLRTEVILEVQEAERTQESK